MKRASTATGLILVILLYTACPAKKIEDLTRKVTAVLNIAEPFVNALGLVPEKAKPIIADFKDAIPVVSTLAADLGAASTLADKLGAGNKAQTAWLAIVNRGHFGVDSRVLSVANTLSGIFSSIVEFYAPGRTVKPSEKEFLRDLSKQVDDLERQVKH